MKKLDRELGLFSVFSISCGAMIGSGIFVLPALAYSIGGPSIFFAYALAGLIVLPTALSKAEMATAMPESGGTYLYLDRSLGPLAGTITGIGTWLSLLLKSSFALVGLSAYLLLFGTMSPSMAKYIALLIAVVLIVLNCFGAKLSGRLQSWLVAVTIASLLFLVGRGSLEIQSQHLAEVFPHGIQGFLSATAFIFVSYAGVTKIASTAEEIRNPDRNIPWGILLSLFTMMFLYTLVAYVIVGVVPGEELLHGGHRLTPVAVTGEILMGPWGLFLMAVIAVMALSSMANAGLLSSSRYPLAMARDRHLPQFFEQLHPTQGTPLRAILLTGGVLVACILFLPVKELAKLASAFKLIVFSLVNLAVIVFRESEIEWYNPDFESVLYPYAQIAGTVTTMGLLAIMSWYDLFPLIGASIVVGLCLLWYFVYARSRMDRSGALFRSPADDEEIKLFQKARTESRTEKESVIVPFFELKDPDLLQAERRIRLAASLCDPGERLDVVHLQEVPEQSFLSGFDGASEAFEGLEQRARLLRSEIHNEIHVDQVITHSSRGALLNYVEEENPHWVVLDWMKPSPWRFLIGTKKWWLEDFPCDLLFFRDEAIGEFENILVLTEPGPFDGEVVYAADHVAEYFDGRITFINTIPEGDSEGTEFVETYQRELQALCQSPSQTDKVSSKNWFSEVMLRARSADLLITGGLTEEGFPGHKENDLAEEISREAECSVARVECNLRYPKSVLKRWKQEGFDATGYLEDEDIYVHMQVQGKQELFAGIARELEEREDRARNIENALWKREHVQNTYIEHGIAFPHGILDEVQGTELLIVLLDEPVEYTPEGDEVKICVVTVGPPGDRQTHLQIIGQLAELFTRENFKETLLQRSAEQSVEAEAAIPPVPPSLQEESS